MTDALDELEKYYAREALALPSVEGRSSRNIYSTVVGSPAHAAWQRLAARGMAKAYPGPHGLRSAVFELTRAGAERALDEGETLNPSDFPTIGQD